MSYRTVQASLGHTPLQDPVGQAWLRAFGIVKDHLSQRARTAVMQRFPGNAAADALGALGTERGIDLGDSLQRSPAEDLPTYRARVRAAWVLWLFGGTALGMLRAFGAQGYYPQIVCANGDVFSLAAGGGQWAGSATWGAGTWGAAAATTTELVITSAGPYTLPWNQFFIWFGSVPSSWTSISSPPTPSSLPSIYEIRRIRHTIIDRWKPAWTRCIGIAVRTGGSPGVWGAPDGVWGDGTWGGTVTWFSATDRLTWGFPPTYEWGMSGLTWGGQV